MEETNTPVADLKREQSEPSAVGRNGLDTATSDALNRSIPALDEGSNHLFYLLSVTMLIPPSTNFTARSTDFQNRYPES